MLVLKLGFKCDFCGEKEKFYTMPVKIKTKSNGYFLSSDKFNLVCKKCNQEYILSVNITRKKINKGEK